MERAGALAAVVVPPNARVALSWANARDVVPLQAACEMEVMMVPAQMVTAYVRVGAVYGWWARLVEGVLK